MRPLVVVAILLVCLPGAPALHAQSTQSSQREPRAEPPGTPDPRPSTGAPRVPEPVDAAAAPIDPAAAPTDAAAPSADASARSAQGDAAPAPAWPSWSTLVAWFAVLVAGVTAVVLPISYLRQLRARSAMQAHRDPHTGLPNRDGLAARFDALAEHAEASGNGLSALVLDIDDFEGINESFGHEAGDQILSAFASRLQLATQRKAELIRLGGDRFVALVPHENPKELEALARRILDACERPIDFPGGLAALTVSIGISQYRRNQLTRATLLLAADAALTAAKKAGKNAWHLYGRDQDGRLDRDRPLFRGNGFDRKGLALYYQPKVSVASGELVGYEALLRKRSRHGLHGAVELLAAAEHSGTTAQLDEWVLRTAASQSRAWRRSGLSIPIAVNGSRLQLHDRRVVALWRELVAADPELPAFLVLEVPVAVLAADGGSAARTLKELAALGLSVHVAGLGTGDGNFASEPSDLAELARLPLGAIKIDRALIAAIPDDDLACESVRRMTSAARSIGIRIIAEGVESEKALRFLRGCGCDEAQGYFLGYPMPAEELGDRASGPPQ